MGLRTVQGALRPRKFMKSLVARDVAQALPLAAPALMPAHGGVRVSFVWSWAFDPATTPFVAAYFVLVRQSDPRSEIPDSKPDL